MTTVIMASGYSHIVDETPAQIITKRREAFSEMENMGLNADTCALIMLTRHSALTNPGVPVVFLDPYQIESIS